MTKDNIHEKQFVYLGRWVSKEHFRAYVYKGTEQKLANSHSEFESLIASGLWLAEKPDVSSKQRKQKYGSDS